MIAERMKDEVNFLVAALLLGWSVWLLARALPAQNIVLILAVLLAGEFALEFICHTGGWLGINLLFWTATILLARIAARWILRRWRQQWNYGVWLILLASTTVALVQFVIAQSGSPWTFAVKLSAIRFTATGFCLFFLSPWFISKFPQQPHDRAQ